MGPDVAFLIGLGLGVLIGLVPERLANRRALRALRELVRVKNMKENAQAIWPSVPGVHLTPEYLRRQRAAWIVARQIVKDDTL